MADTYVSLYCCIQNSKKVVQSTSEVVAMIINIEFDRIRPGEVARKKKDEEKVAKATQKNFINDKKKSIRKHVKIVKRQCSC